MKKVLVLLLLVASFTVSCQKDDDETPTPIPVDNTITKIFNNKSFNGTQFIDLPTPEIDQSVFNTGTVLVSMQDVQTGTDYWEPLPSPSFLNIGYYVTVGEVTVYNYAFTPSTSTFNIKVVIIK